MDVYGDDSDEFSDSPEVLSFFSPFFFNVFQAVLIAEKKAKEKQEEARERGREARATSQRNEKKAKLSKEGVEKELEETTLSTHSLQRARKTRAVYEKRVKEPKYKPRKTDLTPADRVRQYPQQYLIVDAKNQLFCTLCKWTCSRVWKKDAVGAHVRTKKHRKRKAKEDSKGEKMESDRSMDFYLKKSLKENGLAENTTAMDDELHMKRLKGIRAVLKSGVGINGLCSDNGEELKDLLEEGLNIRMGEDRTLRDYIPVLLQAEFLQMCAELKDAGYKVAIVFDGTTRICEVECVLFRFCVPGKLLAQQRVVALHHLTKSLDSKEVAKVVETTREKYNVPKDQILFMNQDRVEVNRKALQGLEILYENSLSLFCLSHTLDKGEMLLDCCSDVTKKLVTKWLKNVWKPGFKDAYKKRYGKFPMTFSKTRWWSRFDVLKEIYEIRGDLENWWKEMVNKNISKKTFAKFLSIVGDRTDLWQVHMDLAFVLDAGLPFYNSCYKLEGDGFLSPVVYGELRRLRNFTRYFTYDYSGTHERIRAVAHKRYPVGPGDQLLQQRKVWIEQMLEKANPWFNYFNDTIMKPDAEMEKERKFFQGCEMWNPGFVRTIEKEYDVKVALNQIPCIRDNPELFRAILKDWPTYRGKIDEEKMKQDLDEKEILSFWERNSLALPGMYSAAQLLILGQPSSASVERVFSILQSSFAKNQHNALADLVSVVVMLKYNDKQRKSLE
jgi:hAT family C-terminal dimerisation region